MPRAKDREVGIMEYFATADLAAAELLHKLAGGVLRGRRPVSRTSHTSAPATPSQSAPKTRARKTKQPVDVPLPGVVSEVGS